MPKANSKSKNCDLCRKPYGSAKRHTVFKRHRNPKYNTVNNVLVVCGDCKSNLHNWQFKYSKSKVAEYNPEQLVSIFGKAFAVTGWFGFSGSAYEQLGFYARSNSNKKRFKNKDKKNKISANSFRRYSRRPAYHGSAHARREWMRQQYETHLLSKNPEHLKKWSEAELREYQNLLRIEREEKKTADDQLMNQLEEEFSEPFRNWLDK